MGEVKQVVIFANEDEEENPLLRKRKMEESPKGMLDTPPDMTPSEWLKMNTIDFYTLFYNIYMTALDDCTPTKCPKMRAGAKFEFLWAEGEYKSRPAHLPARDYIKRLVQWSSALIEDPKIFPPKDAKGIENFREVCARIWSRTIRIVMHIYCHHWQKMLDLEQDELVNEFTKHFIMFALKHKMIARAEYVSPIYEVLNKILPSNYKSLLKSIQGTSSAASSPSKGSTKNPTQHRSKESGKRRLDELKEASPRGRTSSSPEPLRKEAEMLEAAKQAKLMKERLEREREEKQREEEERRRRQEKEERKRQREMEDELEREKLMERLRSIMLLSEAGEGGEESGDASLNFSDETGSIDILSLSASQNQSDIRLVLEMIQKEQARQEAKMGIHSDATEANSSSTEGSAQHSPPHGLEERKVLAMVRKFSSPPTDKRRFLSVDGRRPTTMSKSLGSNFSSNLKNSLSSPSSPPKPSESLNLSPRGPPGVPFAAPVSRPLSINSTGDETTTATTTTPEEKTELKLVEKELEKVQHEEITNAECTEGKM